MKKITRLLLLLLSFFAFIVTAQAQSSIPNVGFEQRTSGVTTSISTPTTIAFKVLFDGKHLIVKNIANGSIVEIYSAIGSKMQTSELVNGSIELKNLSKGLYIVRVGKNTQKIML